MGDTSNLDILLVEDDDGHYQILKRNIQSKLHSPNILRGKTIDEALEIIAKSSLDLVICDYVLPDGKGEEILIEVGPQNALPIIIITGYGDENIAASCIKLGAKDYLVKSPEAFSKIDVTILNVLRAWELEQASERQKIQILKLQQAVEQSPSIVVITDLDGNIEYVNQTFVDVTGYGKEECLGEHTRILKSGEMDPQEYKQLWETIKSGRTWRGEFQNKKKDGTLYWESASIGPLKNDQGEIINYIALKEDITKEKEREKELEASRIKLLAAEKLADIGQLTAGICHEVLNPLNIIAISTQMQQRKHPDGDHLSEHFSRVMGEVVRIEKILRTLLKFSRPQATNSKHASVVEEMESALTLVEKDFRTSNVRLIKDFEESLPPVKVNFDEIRQIFLNLINNAKFEMKEGGELSIKINKVMLNDQDWVQCSISDTGPGMEESVRQKIFNPFFSTKPVGEGAGLGLSVCHTLVEKNGGTIDVQSKPGEGATFILRFPVASVVPEE